MKKVTVSRICSCGLTGLLSFFALIGTNDRVLTQETQDFEIAPSPLSSAPSALSSRMIWPAQGIISQGFRKYQHEGIDIAGPTGTPIFAAASGVVLEAGWENTGLGNAVTIQHSDRRVTVYGHNQHVLVRKGQTVAQGQLIAKMGSTGNSTGPHLHFEIYPNPNSRHATNPLRFLPALVAGNIPPHRIVTSTYANRRPDNFGKRRPDNFAYSMVLPSEAQQVSPSESMLLQDESAGNIDITCSGETVMEGENIAFLVKVCYEDGQLFYIGQLKQDPTSPIKIPAQSVGKNTYQADNGSFSYVVNPRGVKILRDGSLIRLDSFDRSKVSGS
ncbi:hypothetical protein NUACC21_75870 [Scytonema sp. NUACC21]